MDRQGLDYVILKILRNRGNLSIRDIWIELDRFPKDHRYDATEEDIQAALDRLEENELVGKVVFYKAIV